LFKVLILILKLFTPLKELVKGEFFVCLLVKVNSKKYKKYKGKRTGFYYFITFLENCKDAMIIDKG